MKRLSYSHVIVTGIIFLLFMIFILPSEANKSADLGLAESPDTSFFYTEEELYLIADSYGEEGRAFYVHQRFTFDVVWPIAYGLFLTLGVAYFVKGNKNPWIKRSYFLPISAVLFDYLENIMTATVMYRYPRETVIFGNLAGFVTSMKWIALSLAFVLFVVAFIIFTIHKIKERRA